MLIRLMRPEDIPAARALSRAALELLRGTVTTAPARGTFGETDGRPEEAGRPETAGTSGHGESGHGGSGGSDGPDGHVRDTALADGRRSRGRETDQDLWDARWERRAAFFLDHDPEGCWVADDAGEVVGVAMALRRELLWGLSAFFVRPDRQNAGIGSALLDAVLGYSQGCLRGFIISTEDPRAARRYRLAGFTLHPTMRARGVVDRSALPVVDGVRTGDLSDRDLCDSVDRQVRGAAHGVDHDFLAAEYELLVTDTLTGSGYCYVDENGSPALLAATSRKLAHRLLWSALARSRPEQQVTINFLPQAQEWAVDVALAAGLTVVNQGYLCLRHMRPPAPYIPHGAFL